MNGQWGGARRGSGPKPAGWQPPEFDAGTGDGSTITFEAERARHEKVKREQREFKLAVERGEYLPRAVQAQAAATALSVLTQALRTLPDTLERVCALTPEQAEVAQQTVDAALNEVAGAFRAMAGETG